MCLNTAFRRARLQDESIFDCLSGCNKNNIHNSLTQASPHSPPASLVDLEIFKLEMQFKLEQQKLKMDREERRLELEMENRKLDMEKKKLEI